MKLHLLFKSVGFAPLLIAGVVFGQANFLLRNVSRPMLDAPVFDANGTPLWGGSYLAELWGAADPNLLTPAVVIDQGFRREFTPFTFVSPGYFSSPEVYLCVLSVPPRGSAWLQVRAWDSRLGATYEEVAALGQGGFGESNLFYTQGGDPFDQFPVPGPLIGLQSFSLRPIPEPSTWMVGVLGLASLWFMKRRKRS